MRHFDFLDDSDRDRLFHRPPERFDVRADRTFLATALGATLYCPATRPKLADDLARRAAELIRQKFGVRFHPSYLREWLSKRNYTPQKPARRPRQRDPAKIDRWVAEDWPRIQKRRGRTAPTSS